ncbi:MAG: hypothetical protein K8R53_03095 [Bacteroidales bacterium]|nr:hypothetical protein [Bacteroidales bacterium]
MIDRYGTYVLIVILCFSIAPGNDVHGQEDRPIPKYDTVHLTIENMIVFRDSILVPLGDTTILIEEGTRYKVKKNRYKKSSSFYDSVYSKTHTKKITRQLYGLVLSHRPDDPESNTGEHIEAKIPFDKYQGKRIKSIRFIKVDILEGSVDDTLKSATSGFGKLLNKTHVNTHDRILKKYMLVEPGDTIIPSVLSDNERIIRNISGIEDVRFLVIPDTLDRDVADLIVVTKDMFPLTGSASASSLEKFSAGIGNNNLFGVAFEVSGKLMYESQYRNPLGYEIKGKYPNFFGTFIDGEITWIDAFDTQGLRLSLNKGFVTPQTKYGGGISLGWVSDKYEISNSDTIVTGIYETDYQDFWLGRSFLMGDKSSRNNLILSVRFEREEFMRRPFIDPDSNVAYHNKKIYYAKIGYAHLNYYKTSMLRSFGIAEDIPYGLLTGLTIAYMEGDYLHRFYWGYNIGAGKYYDNFGYIAAGVIIGGFYRNGSVSQGLLENNIIYYTPLIQMNRYSSRQFLFVKYRQTVTRDVKTRISVGDEIREIDQSKAKGLSTLIFNYEYVLFSPWYLYGFHFAPYVFADLGLVSSSRNILNHSGFVSSFGLGIRIRNESLAFKTIILSIGFIPSTFAGGDKFFYNFSLGENPLIDPLSIDKPYILRRDLIFPF